MFVKFLEIVVDCIVDCIVVFDNVIGYFVWFWKLNFLFGGRVDGVWVMVNGGDMDFLYL